MELEELEAIRNDFKSAHDSEDLDTTGSHDGYNTEDDLDEDNQCF